MSTQQLPSALQLIDRLRHYLSTTIENLERLYERPAKKAPCLFSRVTQLYDSLLAFASIQI
jgi:predicted acetyltransferase